MVAVSITVHDLWVALIVDADKISVTAHTPATVVVFPTISDIGNTLFVYKFEVLFAFLALVFVVVIYAVRNTFVAFSRR